MSLAEVMPYQDEAPRGPDRTPPQDMNAEQCVLGAMLMSKDAIADVVEVLRGNDFYRPAHEQVYEAIIDLYGRGEPADAVTVSDLLGKRGELMRLGGAPYLHTLLASVPIAANAGWYAEIVREKAILRRLVDASIRIGQMSYAGEGAVDEIVDRAQAEVYSVTERRASEDYKPLSELMQPTLDEMEAISSRGGGLSGVPTGFADLDELTNGLHPGQMIIVAARPGMGKALALDTPLPTPTGWTTMGAVQVGDLLIGWDGRPTRVVAATEILLGRPCFEITFSDGATVTADADHQWQASNRAMRVRARAETMQSHRFVEVLTGGGHERPAPGAFHRQIAEVTTAEMARTVRLPDGTCNWTIAGTRPLDLATTELPLDAYRLGWLLADPRAAGEIDADRVPIVYRRAAELERRSVLAGLADRLGEVGGDGAVTVSVGSARLAADVHDLICGLGASCEWLDRPGGSVQLRFHSAADVFRHSPQHTRHRLLRRITDSGRRYVTAVEPVASVPVRCVEVDSPDHLYLATRSMVPTHNSTLALDLARSASIKNGLTSCIFSLEMSQIEITMRLLSAEASIPLNHIRNGRMSDDDWQRVAQKMGQVSEAPLYIDDSPNLTMMEIRAKARRLRQRHDLRLVVIDYIQLMTSGKKVESRQLEVSEFSRQLKLLAKELEVPVVALSQLNRGPEQRTDKKPMLSDLRESGSLEQDSDLVILLNRPDIYDKESDRAGEADIDVAKHRNGPTKTLTVAFQGHYSRFTDMQH